MENYYILKGSFYMNFNLNYEGFEDYLVEKKPMNVCGIDYVFRFENGYGASVIKAYWTYGGPQDLWELSVIRFFGKENNDYELDYFTEITDDACGYETDDGIRKLLARIKALENPDK